MLSTTDTFCVERLAGSRRPAANARNGSIRRVLFSLFVLLALAAPMMARGGRRRGQSATARSRQATFLGGINGHNLLLGGLVVSALGLVFGLIIFVRLRNMPVHDSMREVSELIYETCKTYLATQGKFLMLLEVLHRGHHRFLLRRAAGIRGL